MTARGHRTWTSLIAALVALGVAALAPPALADFPYAHPGADEGDYTDLYAATDQVPNDLSGDSNEFKYAATPDPANHVNNARGEIELNGVRGAHVVDRDPAADTAWEITTGRPDVTLAVLDSGIRWDASDAMVDLRFKTRLNQGELPIPDHARSAPLATGADCASFADAHDANGDNVFNLADYVCDSRVDLEDPRRDGPAGMLTPQDVLIAFSDGSDADGNGYVDDIVGWDFLDDDNDPFDDVSYGHGTGEARGSTSEADNHVGDDGDNVGSCPNCMVIHMRVGDSFIADVNRFAAAVTYATDNDVEVVQSALGTLNNSSISRQAVEYAYDHGVTVILSAADEAAQHNNQPSLPHSILVNSVTRDPVPEPNRSYLDFNGCTNFNVKITVAIPSTSCSSDAVGVSSGLAGLIYSAAYNAFEQGALSPNQRCTLTGDGPDPDGAGPDSCVISPSEVRQLLASGRIGDQTMVDDVDFAGTGGPSGAEPDCTPPVPGCTDPNLALQTLVNLNRPRLIPNSFSYPARTGHDQFYGYGRVNTRRSVEALVDDPASPSPSLVPPEVELTSPQWYEQVDPARSSFAVEGEVWARGGSFTCRVLVAPGHYPNQGEAPEGDFTAVPSPGVCDGTTTHTEALDGELADVSVATLKSLFPPDASQGAAAGFTGRETGAGGVQTSGGRPNTDPYGFEVKVVATTTQAGTTLTGEDYRGAFLHRDQDLLPGFPKAITGGGSVESSPSTPTGDGESSPAFADLDGDNRNEMVFGSSDGFVHALTADGSELPGWPVRADRPGFIESHLGSRAYATGAVSTNLGGAMLASVAVGDANGDGAPEVYVADLEGKVYGWSAEGERIFEAESNPAFSGAPLEPFVENRAGSFNRTQHGFIGSPVLADIDGDDGGRMEIVAAAMDRHLYAWHHDGSAVHGFPALVVDPAKVAGVDPQTHRIDFRPDAGSEQQGGIIATPAVGDLDGDVEQGEDRLPEIVVGTNEEYRAGEDGGFNGGIANSASLNLIDQMGEAVDAFKAECGADCEDLDNPLPIDPGNARLYAISAHGDRDGDPLPGDETLRPGWPAKLGMAMTGLLPVVGEGVAGAPVIAPAVCGPNGAGMEPRVGAAANNGPAYVLSENGDSCYGEDPQGRDIPLQTDAAAGSQYDHPFLPAVGNPAFGDLGEGSPSFLLPAAGLFRALDLGLPEYQRGQDYIGAWSVTGGGQFRPNWPATMNDLQFLTGPAVADLDGLPGEEVVEGSASKEVTALNAAGTPVNARWPKVTSDWTVATPLVGSFGTLDTDEGARKVVVNMTRSGYVHAYETDAPACSPASSPRFHHDNANSGDFGRDAVLPGRPMGLAFQGGAGMRLTAPGDDLLCGTADRYELVTSAQPIDEGNFAQATPLDGAPEPREAGTEQAFTLPPGARRFVAIRAVDEQGNVGRPAVVARGTSGAGSPGAGSGPAPGPEPTTLPSGSSPPDGGPPSVCANLVKGTGGRDRLLGTDGPDRLRGRRGDDRLRGLAGDDCVAPGGGEDRVDAGSGADAVRSADGEPDRVRCGPGADVARIDRHDRVSGCERVRGPD